MSYHDSFTIDDLEKIIGTNKNTVVTYPAGTGKTTAIVDYLCKHILDSRKVIYIAPTCSLLDNMYNKLIAAGINDKLIFNYHSKSKQWNKLRYYTESRTHTKKEYKNYEDIATSRIKDSRIILITHKRMMFESANRFLSGFDTMLGSKPPLVFIDEAIEPINVATITKRHLELLMRDSGVIKQTDSMDDFKINRVLVNGEYKEIDEEDAIQMNSKLLSIDLCKPIYRLKDGTWRIGYPSERDIRLLDPCGFEVTEMTSVLAERIKCLYWLFALQVAKGDYLEEDNDYLVNLPVALHLMWQKYAQIVIMDATAYLSPSLYEGFEIITSYCWNFDKLRNTIYHHKLLSKSKLKDNPKLIPIILKSIDFNKYNKIYISSCKSFSSLIYEYFNSKYGNEYKIVYSAANSQVLVSDVDYNSDEDYLTSGIDPSTGKEYDKVIYISNYGRTRGSNIFRNCECVVQVGVFRMKPETLNMIQRVYKKLNHNELPLANFIQELYRGRIRCDEYMDSYSIIDEELYLDLIDKLPNFKFTDKSSSDFSEFSQYVKDCYIDRDRYGKHGKIITMLYNAKSNNRVLSKDDLFKMFNSDRLDNIRRSIIRIYNTYPELMEDLFNNYPSEELLTKALTLDNKYADIKFKL